MIFATRLPLGRIISARTLLDTAVQRDFSIASSAARLRLWLVIVATRLRLGRINSARTLLLVDTAVQHDSPSGPRNIDAVDSAIRLRLGRVILLLTLLHTAVQCDISAARLRLGRVTVRGHAQLQPYTDLGRLWVLKILVLHQGRLEGYAARFWSTLSLNPSRISKPTQ